MNPNPRKPFGIIAILLLIALWSMLVASAAQAIGSLPGWLQLAIYVIAGIAWIFPVMPILRWIETGRWRE